MLIMFRNNVFLFVLRVPNKHTLLKENVIRHALKLFTSAAQQILSSNIIIKKIESNLFHRVPYRRIFKFVIFYDFLWNLKRIIWTISNSNLYSLWLIQRVLEPSKVGNLFLACTVQKHAYKLYKHIMDLVTHFSIT